MSSTYQTIFHDCLWRLHIHCSFLFIEKGSRFHLSKTSIGNPGLKIKVLLSSLVPSCLSSYYLVLEPTSIRFCHPFIFVFFFSLAYLCSSFSVLRLSRVKKKKETSDKVRTRKKKSKKKKIRDLQKQEKKDELILS